jgi:hypothetical protein
MAATKFTAIIPKTPLTRNPVADLEKALLDWGGDVVKGMAKYPAQQPTKYRRTGTLGRGWRTWLTRESGRLRVDVENAVVYAPYVEGSEQSRVMRAKGWQRLDEVGKGLLSKLEAALGQAFQRSINR